MSYSRNAGRAKGSGAVVSPSVRTSSEREHHATRHLHQANSPPGPWSVSGADRLIRCWRGTWRWSDCATENDRRPALRL